ncbi:MAG: hypothetical protein RIS85_2113 [Pseudomonadota bacterium]|jgi:hypothetical protein
MWSYSINVRNLPLGVALAVFAVPAVAQQAPVRQPATTAQSKAPAPKGTPPKAGASAAKDAKTAVNPVLRLDDYLRDRGAEFTAMDGNADGSVSLQELVIIRPGSKISGRSPRISACLLILIQIAMACCQGLNS